MTDPATNKRGDVNKRGHVAALALMAVVAGAGELLVTLPILLPRSWREVLAVSFGAILLVIFALLVGSYTKVATWFSDVLDDFPRRLGGFARQPLKLTALALALLVSAGSAVAARQLIVSPDIEPGELVIMSAPDEGPNDPRRILISQWNETHPGNQVSIIDVPGEPDEQHATMVGDAKPGGANKADVYVLDNVWMSRFIKQNYILPLNESLRTSKDEDFFRNVLATSRDTYGRRKGGLWGIPLNTDVGLLFKRSDIPGLQTPASWDHYMGQDAAEVFADVKAKPENRSSRLESASAAQFAHTSPDVPTSSLAEEILAVTAFEAMWAEGSEIVNQDGTLTTDQNGNVAIDDQAQAGMAKLAAALKDRRITLPDAKEADEDAAVRAYKEGRSLFMRNWPISNDKLRGSSSRDTSLFEVSELPHESALGGQNLAISGSTDKPRAAQALIEFLTSSASQLILFEIGGFAPSRPGVYAAASRPYKNELRASIEDARPRPVTPCYIEFSQEFRNGVVRALQNEGTFEPDFPSELAKIAMPDVNGSCQSQD